MRKFALLATAATLSACGGGGGSSPLNSGGTVAPPLSIGGQAPASGHTFVTPKEARTYQAVGASHSLAYEVNELSGTQGSALYAGNASTARNSGIEVAYDPRDAIFELTIKDPLANVSQEFRFQDPVHRTNFGGAREPQAGVSDLSAPGLQYLQAGSASGVFGEVGYNYDVSTFFYQKPGTSTRYVTFGGFLRNSVTIKAGARENGDPYKIYDYVFERSAFAYGERSRDQDVPRTGTGTYNGNMVATMVFNDQRDIDVGTPTYFQWLEGTSQLRVDFGKSSFEVDLSGRAFAPANLDATSGQYTIRNGATFNANGSGRIDLALQGGFLGDFQRAWFVNPDGRRLDLQIAGSSVNGAFYGPAADEIGGGFRIVGGRPDERIDILGAFVGKK